MSENLLRDTWIDHSDELRILLKERFGYGQIDGDPYKLYLPLARDKSRIVVTFAGNKKTGFEPGEAFDFTEWERLSEEIEHSI